MMVLMTDTVHIPPHGLFEQGHDYEVAEDLAAQLLYQGLAVQGSASDPEASIPPAEASGTFTID